MSGNVQGAGDASASVGGPLPPVQVQGTGGATTTSGEQMTVPFQQDTIASADESSKGMTIQADSPKPQQPEVIDGAAAGMTPQMLMKLTPEQLGMILANQGIEGSEGQKTGLIVGVSKFVMEMMNKLYEIARSVLDSWVESLKEEADRVKAYLNSAEYQKKLMDKSPITQAKNEREAAAEVRSKGAADYQAEITSASQLQRDYLVQANAHADAIGAVSSGMQVLVNDLSSNSTDPRQEVSLKERTNIAVSTLVVASGVTTAVYAGATIEASLVAYNPISDSVNAATQANPNQPVDNSAAIAMMAALFGSGMLRSATVDAYVTAQGAGKEPNRADVAQAFVGKVFEHIYSKEFEVTALNLMVADPQKRLALSQDPVGMLTALAPLRFATLSVSLEVVHGALNQPLTGQRFLELVNSDPSKLDPQVYGTLLQSAQVVIRGLQSQLANLPPESRERLKTSMAAHFDARVEAGESTDEYFEPLSDLDTIVRSLPRQVAPMLA